MFRILDGAMGTELQRAGFELQAPSFAIAANSLIPNLVQGLHQRYAQAGAQELTLNSFGLSVGLAQGDPEFASALAKRAQSALDRAQAFCGELPLCGALSWGRGPDPLSRLLAEAQSLLGVGVKHLRIETLCDAAPLKELRGPLLAALVEHNATLCLSLCPQTQPVIDLAAQLQRQGWYSAKPLVALGLNCIDLETMDRAADAWVQWLRDEGLRLNVGLELRPHLSKQSTKGEWQTHAVSPQTWSRWAKALLKRLAKRSRWPVSLGTCCGGGPEHIHALREVRDIA